MVVSTSSFQTGAGRAGLVVDAGAGLGYGHAVRCLRLAEALGPGTEIYPLSTECRAFFESNGFQSSLRDFSGGALPEVVVTDLRETHGITATIRRSGSLHVSLHDLGLGQCRSDVAIDGSIVRLFPFTQARPGGLFVGPAYMITRPAVYRSRVKDTVLVTLGGGRSAAAVDTIAAQLEPLGLRVVAAGGFCIDQSLSNFDMEAAMSRALFAVSASGTTLYDLLASGVPTIAVAVDRLQLRTTDAFHAFGAVQSAGLLEKLSLTALMKQCRELAEDAALRQRMTSIGKRLVDGSGLSRVVGIIRDLQLKSCSSKSQPQYNYFEPQYGLDGPAGYSQRRTRGLQPEVCRA